MKSEGNGAERKDREEGSSENRELRKREGELIVGAPNTQLFSPMHGLVAPNCVLPSKGQQLVKTN